jgi:hypothetical protein
VLINWLSKRIFTKVIITVFASFITTIKLKRKTCVQEMIHVLVRKSEGTKLLGRYWHTWEYNIKLNLQEMGSEGVNWIQLALVRIPLIVSHEHDNKLSGCIKGKKFLDQLTYYKLIKNSS